MPYFGGTHLPKLFQRLINPLTLLIPLDFAYQGGPFAEGAIDYTLAKTLNGMDYAHQGGPFVTWSNVR